MLPASLFAPLDLAATVEDVRRTQGAHGVVDLLVLALTEKRGRADVDIDEHLDTLKAACRQTRRHRDLVPVLEHLAAAHPQRRHELVAELALVYAHLGERAKALALLESALAQQLQLPVSRRSLGFSIVAEVAAHLLRKPELAQRCADLGRSTGVAVPAKAKRAAPAARKERSAPAARADRGTAAERTTAERPKSERPAARRRVGLARPVLASQPMLGELEAEPATAGRPVLTLITGSAA